MEAAHVNIQVLDSDLPEGLMQRVQDSLRVLMVTKERAPLANEVVDALCALPNPVTPPDTTWFCMQVEERDNAYTHWHGRVSGYDEGTFSKIRLHSDPAYLYFIWRARCNP